MYLYVPCILLHSFKDLLLDVERFFFVFFLVRSIKQSLIPCAIIMLKFLYT